MLFKKNRFKKELMALGCAFVPIAGNDNTKKIFALAMLFAWIGLTVASAAHLIDLNTISYTYDLLTAAVFLLLGRLWGLEYERLFGGRR